jgi:hypothetical protein
MSEANILNFPEKYFWFVKCVYIGFEKVLDINSVSKAVFDHFRDFLTVLT